MVNKSYLLGLQELSRAAVSYPADELVKSIRMLRLLETRCAAGLRVCMRGGPGW